MRAAGLLWRALRQFERDRGLFLASALAFNILLSFIPLALLLLSVLGSRLYGDAELSAHLADYLRSLLPALDPKITASLVGLIRHRRIAGLAGTAGLLWTSTLVFGSLRISLNVIFGVVRGRGTIRGLGVDLLLVLTCGTLLTASMALTSAVTYLQRHEAAQLLGAGLLLKPVLKYVLPLLFTALMSFTVYRIAPNRRVSAGPTLKAAVFTSLLWETAKHLFGFFLLHLGRFSLVYGPLSAAAVFVLWVYYSAVIFLLGGEVLVALEGPGGPRQRRHGAAPPILPA